MRNFESALRRYRAAQSRRSIPNGEPMGLDTVELVMAVEQRFSIRIPNQVAAQLVTVGQMHQYVVVRLRQRGANPDSEAIYTVLADVISTQLGVKREVVRREASFVDDLGPD